MSRAGKRAVVLLSGGLDSTTTLAIAQAEGFSTYALTVSYGQRHQHELACARRIAGHFGTSDHIELSVDLRAFGGSALTSDAEVPKDRRVDDRDSGIPLTYVPARNAILLSLALAWAEALGSEDLFIGVNAVDYSGYPDCRPEFIRSFEELASSATKAGVEMKSRFKVHAPLIKLTKAQIISKGIDLGVDYSMTSTCYDPSSEGAACGRCDACQLRLRGFQEAGVADPVPYQTQKGP